MTYICLVHICSLLQQHLHNFGMIAVSRTPERGAAMILKISNKNPTCHADMNDNTK